MAAIESQERAAAAAKAAEVEAAWARVEQAAAALPAAPAAAAFDLAREDEAAPVEALREALETALDGSSFLPDSRAYFLAFLKNVVEIFKKEGKQKNARRKREEKG